MVDPSLGFDPLEAQFTLAQQLEEKEQWEGAYKNYHEVEVKAKNMIANQPNSAIKKALEDLQQRASLQSQWCKQMLEDKKRLMQPKMARQASSGKHKIGLAFLGSNFI